jgi:hypothetical protein
VATRAGRITIELVGLEELSRKLKPRLYEQAVATLMEDITIVGERTAKQRAPRDTGALKRSIHSQAKPFSARIFSNLGYAVPVEYGRGRNKRMPPPSALHGWLRRHGKPASAAFVVARAIGRRGIKGRFFMRAAEEAIRAKLPSMMDRTVRAIGKRWKR